MSLNEIPENKRWKYAKPEYERRFLIPPPEVEGLPSKRITDKYIHHSDMRLRRVKNGLKRVYKLTKKKMLQHNQRQAHWTSTIYLNPVEYEMFNDLPGWVINKTRFYPPPMDDTSISYDQINFEEETIWIAEVEFDSEEEMVGYILPINMIREITNEEDFSGYDLAVRQRQNL